MTNTEFKHEEITKAIIGASFEVYNEPGYGFLEKVYQRSLQVELMKRGYAAELEPSLEVKFKGVIVGDYKADILVDNKVIVELKASKRYNSQDEAQLLNELRASEVESRFTDKFWTD